MDKRKFAVLVLELPQVKELCELMGVEFQPLAPSQSIQELAASKSDLPTPIPTPTTTKPASNLESDSAPESDPIEDVIDQLPLPTKTTEGKLQDDTLNNSTPNPSLSDFEKDSIDENDDDDDDDDDDDTFVGPDSPIISSPIKCSQKPIVRFDMNHYGVPEADVNNAAVNYTTFPKPSLKKVTSPNDTELILPPQKRPKRHQSLEEFSPADVWSSSGKLYSACECFWLCIFVAKACGYNDEVDTATLAKAESDIVQFYNDISPRKTVSVLSQIQVEIVFEKLASKGSLRTLNAIQKLCGEIDISAVIPYLHYVAACKQLQIEPLRIPRYW
ncbi:hypothetical protein DIURU_004367 [Diutina rugosa]|uniref:Uncharacterized protein n=1 Tax=Diutina rugosa TaxID=5481 RepID=A0A642UHW1_DIURU|nr:uncharacterized protein DIURU_004367 [Diutina rugosa]KAA8899345.1 hypothetical protein DIURU_004367 [Diutina rugosa]